MPVTRMIYYKRFIDVNSAFFGAALAPPDNSIPLPNIAMQFGCVVSELQFISRQFADFVNSWG